MATSNPDGTLSSGLSGLQGLLDKVIGSKTVGTDQRSLVTQQLLDSLINQNSTENTANTTTGNTSAIQQILSQLTGTTQQTTQNTADVGALKTVFGQQQGGISPEALAAIFSEGAKAAPGLVATTANAVGARSGNNSPLATALTELNASLVNQAATQSQAMRNASAGTAAEIAKATGGTTTTGSSTQGQTQNSSNTGTSSQQQNIQKILEQITGQKQSTDTNQQMRDDTTSTTGINTKQTAAAAGLAGLISLLGAQGGGGSTDILSQLSKLIPGLAGSAGSGLFQGGTGNIFDTGGSVPLPEGVGGYEGSNPYLGGGETGFTYTEPSIDDVFTFADGGVVDKPKMLSINDKVNTGPNIDQILALVGTGVDLDSLLQGVSLNKSTAAQGGGSALAPFSKEVGEQQKKDYSNIGTDYGVDQVGGGMSTGSPGQWGDVPIGPDELYEQWGGVENTGNYLKSLGYKGSTDRSYTGGVEGTWSNNQEIAQFLSESGITFKSAYDNERSDSYHLQAVDKEGNPIGNERIGHPSNDSEFGLVLAGLASLAGGAAGAGIAASAGYGAGTAIGGAASGAGAGFAGTAASTGDAGAALKGAAVGGVTGGITAGMNPGLKKVVTPVVKGAIKKNTGWADGGVFPRQSSDPSGTQDGITIRVSGGEGMLPTDVVDAVGPEFVESLIAMFHTPVALQP